MFTANTKHKESVKPPVQPVQPTSINQDYAAPLILCYGWGIFSPFPPISIEIAKEIHLQEKFENMSANMQKEPQNPNNIDSSIKRNVPTKTSKY